MMTIDELMDVVCNEMAEYEIFWGKPAFYLLLGIEEMDLVDRKLARNRDILIKSTLLGMQIIPVHDSYHHIGVA